MLSGQEIQALTYAAYEMRKDVLTMCHNCGNQNGHLGGAMSAIEILAVLYLKQMNLSKAYQGDIDWEDRDRFIMSKGHGAMAMYAALKQLGILSQCDIEKSIRGSDSIISRHPKRNTEYAIECSVGSLGQGIGYGAGIAQGLKRKKSGAKVYVMVGDGECNEGSVWEAACYASHRKLDNFVVIIDKNNLQLDGKTADVLSMEKMEDKWDSFGFVTVEINGHDFNQAAAAFLTAHTGRPLAIIAETVKGKGVSFAENRVEWHDNYLSDELYKQGLAEVESALDRLGFHRKEPVYRLAAQNGSKKISPVNSDPVQELQLFYDRRQIDKWRLMGYKKIVGEAAYGIARTDPSFTIFYADCKNRIGLEKAAGKYPECCMEAGIAEQNMISMAAGMQSLGFHSWAVAYAPFITFRVLDQVRVNLGYMKHPVKLIGLSSGVISSDLGSTHIAIEDIACMRAIPNMTVIAPADTTEIMKAFQAMHTYNNPVYLRITAPVFKDQLIYKEDYSFKIGKANILQQGEDIALISCGTILMEVLRAAKKLKKLGISCKVIDMHTIKPIDTDCIDGCRTAGLLVTVEEHNVIGGLGSAVGEYLAEKGNAPALLRLGIRDTFFTSDLPENILMKCNLDAEGIIERILKLWNMEGRG